MADGVDLARNCFRQRAWVEAHSAFLRAREGSLSATDLEQLAIAAYLIGRQDDFHSALERAYRTYLQESEAVRAGRCAFWLGLILLFRGEAGHANAWFARAAQGVTDNSVIEGYLLLPAAEQDFLAGDFATMYASACRAAAIGERFDDTDLLACAQHLQGRALIVQGRLDEGMAFLDRAMLAASEGALSPLMTGLIYCSVIDACQRVFAVGRSREWTLAFSRWCEAQPQMVTFSSTCLVHRAEIFEMQGAWQDAIAAAKSAQERFARGLDLQPCGAAFYRQGEVRRLQGDFEAAEAAYRAASQHGFEPQPGLALLRKAQGRVDAAAATMRRLMSETRDDLERTRLLPAHIEILLAASDVETARSACSELERAAERYGTPMVDAMGAHARGAVDLAGGDTRAAVASLRRAARVWQELDAPYAAACTRELLGVACRALNDEDGCQLELDAARATFAELRALPDVKRLEALNKPAQEDHGLSHRELEVLRLLATGKTNKTIAEELSLSERTVDRHVSNLFVKLNVASRAAATAYAYENGLI